MFYSEVLLSKTGPLARVWLSANLERKLSKSHILQQDIESSIHAIVDQGQGPMALRLSAQLLLGVVRIYSRKTRYLLDDCNEALMKIKMTFRTANSDDASAGLVPAAAITLPETLTVDDLLANLDIDASLSSLLSTQPISKGIDAEESSAMDWMSSPPTQSRQRNAPEDRPQLEDDYGIVLDIGDDEPLADDHSIHIGRDAPAPRPVGDDLFSDEPKLLEDPGITLDLDDEPMEIPLTNGAAEPHDDLNNFLGDDAMDIGANEFDLPEANGTELPVVEAENEAQRTQTPDGDGDGEVRSSVLRDLDETHGEEEVAVHQAQRTKKRKLVQPDTDTVLHNRQIKEQQADRSKILKPTSFLPRDPFLLTLMNMQKNGDFVSRVMGNGRAKGWAPELREILSIEIVRKSGELKRKRDSGVADMEDDATSKSPRLEFEDDQFIPADEGLGIGGDSMHERSTMIDLPAGDDARPGTRDSNQSGDGANMPEYDGFDDTTMPLVHPADSGPVSLGTKHAVHLLRERFGGEGSSDSSPSSQRKASVFFQDLLPERKTSKADATKMFFEVLVLATKDAVKVEQSGNEIGGPLRIRGKRGLWGSWAETEAGGEIATQASQIPA